MHFLSRAAKWARREQPAATRLLFVLTIILTLASCGVSATGGWHGTAPGESLRKNTTLDSPYGPVYPADVKLLVAVAQAGLWEGPASEDVARRSTNAKVRAVAAQLAREHHDLNEINTAAAARVRVQLPQAPTPQQKGWLDQIRAASGDQLDRLYVTLTRAAHGTVYMAITTVRSTTQNDVVRSMAAIAAEYVARHMALLESTGLASYDALAVHSGTDAQYQSVPAPTDFGLGIVLAVALGLATLVLVRLGSRARPTEAAEEEEEAPRWA
jgi:putative membrane protein